MIVRADSDLRLAVLRVDNKIPSELGSLIPDWLKTILIDGDLLIFSKEDYASLAPEVVAHLEVLAR